MISQRSAAHSLTRNIDQANLVAFARIQRVGQRRNVTVLAGIVPTQARWLAVWRAIACVCLVIVIGVAVARALQLYAESTVTRAEASEQGEVAAPIYADGACSPLDDVRRTMTIDELHDLQDELCPLLADPRLTSN